MKSKLIGVTCAFSFTAMIFAAPPANIALESPLANENAPTTIQAPAQISVKKDSNKGVPSCAVVESQNTLQDAAIHADRNMQETATMLKCGSGIGFLARGEASYSQYKNRNISLIAQRQAYVQALADARKNLLAYLENMPASAQEAIQKEMIAVDDANDDAGTRVVNKEFSAESAKTAVQGLLQGYSIFSVRDDGATVTVSIISSPLTRSGGLALSGGMMISGSYQEAFNKFYAELKTGTLPPEGSKVFLIADGQGNAHPFFVSFGSSIIRRAAGNDASLQRSLLTVAEKQAEARAAVNLCRLLSGDQASWTFGYIEMTEKNEATPGMGKALAALSDDTLKKIGLGKEVADDLQNSFINIMKTQETWSAATQGQVPAGVRRIKWTDDKGDWAYFMMIYNPSMTQQVRIAKNQVYSGQEEAPRKSLQQSDDPSIKRIDSVNGNAADF